MQAQIRQEALFLSSLKACLDVGCRLVQSGMSAAFILHILNIDRNILRVICGQIATAGNLPTKQNDYY